MDSAAQYVGVLFGFLGRQFAHLSDFLSRVWIWITELGDTLWSIILSFYNLWKATHRFGTEYIQVIVNKYGIEQNNISIYVGSLLILNGPAAAITWWFDQIDVLVLVLCGVSFVTIGLFALWNHYYSKSRLDGSEEEEEPEPIRRSMRRR